MQQIFSLSPKDDFEPNNVIESNSSVSQNVNKKHQVKEKYSDVSIKNKQAYAKHIEINESKTAKQSKSTWLQLAFRAFSGDRSPEVIAWQKANRLAKPALAKLSDDLQASARPVELAYTFLDEMTDAAIVRPLAALGREAARLRLGHNTETGNAFRSINEFLAKEQELESQGLPTQTDQFLSYINSFMKEEAGRLVSGDKTITGDAIYNELYMLRSTAAKEIVAAMGHDVGTGLIMPLAFGASGVAAKTVGKAAAPVVKRVGEQVVEKAKAVTTMFERFKNTGNNFIFRESELSEIAATFASNKLPGNIIPSQTELKLNPEQLIRVHSISGKGSATVVKQLAESMRLSGFDINEPIEVVINNDKFYIIDGHHRYRAAQMAGVNEIPVKVISDIKNHPSSWNTIEEVVKDASSCGHDNLKFRY